MCSDGVWEFLQNDKVMQTTIPYLKNNLPESACKNIIKNSKKCWEREDTMRDDITAIVIFINV